MFLESVTSKIQSIIKYALYASIALFPFIVFKSYLYNGTSARSVLLTLAVEILVVVLVFALFSKQQRLKIIKSPITLALLVYFVISCISAIGGIDPLTSFWSKATRMTGLFYLSHLAVFYLFLTMIFREEGDVRKFIKIFLVSSGIFSIGSLLSAEGLNLIFKTQPWDGFTFGNSTFAAMYLFAAFLLSIYFVWLVPSGVEGSKPKKERPWWKYFIPIIFIINPNFINKDFWFGQINILQNPLGVVGEARATTYVAILSVLFLVFAWLISKIKDISIRRKIIIGSAIAGVIFAGVATYSFMSPGGYIREAYLKEATTARPLVWELSGKAIAERPIFGWGPDNFERVFEKHYDNRLLQAEFGAEAWFDRAHNVFIDQAVDTGYAGLISYLLIYAVILLCLLYVILNSKKRNDQMLAVILVAYFAFHLAELQTAFDTSISYIAVAIMAALAAILFHKTWTDAKEASYAKGSGPLRQSSSAASEPRIEKTEWIVKPALRYTFGIVLIGYFGWAFFAGTIPIMKAEAVNGPIRAIGSTEKRLPLYDSLFGSPMDQPAFIWRILTDFQRGFFKDPKSLEDPKKIAGYIKEFDLYATQYKEYLAKHPDDIRAHYTSADILIYERLFEIDHLKEAQEVLDKAIALNPSIPQPYWMKAVASLYQRKFDLAREWAKRGLELNPKIKESQKVVSYIEESIKTFPEIDLYFFSSI